jgi:hypothetical protein
VHRSFKIRARHRYQCGAKGRAIAIRPRPPRMTAFHRRDPERSPSVDSGCLWRRSQAGRFRGFFGFQGTRGFSAYVISGSTGLIVFLYPVHVAPALQGAVRSRSSQVSDVEPQSQPRRQTLRPGLVLPPPLQTQRLRSSEPDPPAPRWARDQIQHSVLLTPGRVPHHSPGP